jgi:hypothetical protein
LGSLAGSLLVPVTFREPGTRPDRASTAVTVATVINIETFNWNSGVIDGIHLSDIGDPGLEGQMGKSFAVYNEISPEGLP